MHRWLPLLGVLASCASQPYVVRLSIQYDAPRSEASTVAVPQSWHDSMWIRAMAVSPGGGLVATAEDDVRLWDATTGGLRAVLPETSGPPVIGLAFEYEPHELVVAREDGRVDGWNLRTGELETVVEPLGHVVIDREANLVGSGPLGLVLGAASGWTNWHTHVRYGGGEVTSVARSERNGRWALAADDGGVYFGRADRRLHTVVEPHETFASDWMLAVSSSGRLMAGARRGGVIVWEASEWRPRTEASLRGMHVHAEHSPCLRADAEIVAMRFVDEELVVADTAGGVTLIDHDGRVHTIAEPDYTRRQREVAAFSGRGATLAYIDGADQIGVQQLLRARRSHEVGWQQAGLYYDAVAVDATGDALVTTHGDRFERWDLTTRRIERLEVEAPRGIRDMTLTDDGATVRVRSDGWPLLTDVPLDGDGVEAPLDEEAEVPSWVEGATSLDVSDDGTLAVAFVPSYQRGAPHRLLMRSLDGERRESRAMPERLAAVALSPDGFAVAAVDEAGRVSLYEAASLRLMSSFPDYRDTKRGRFVEIAEYGSDGTLALVRNWSELELVDLDEGTRDTVALGGSIRDLSFSADGRLLAAAGPGGPWLVAADEHGRWRSLALVRDGDQTFGVVRPDGMRDGAVGSHAPWVRVGSAEAGTLLGVDQSPAGLRREGLLADLLAGRRWTDTAPPIVPAEVRIHWLHAYRERFSVHVDVRPGDRPVDEVCISIETVGPSRTHTMCLRGETRREIVLRGRPDVVRAQACEAGGLRRQTVVEQWEVKGEELLEAVAG